MLLVPLDDIVVFPNMNVTISADMGDEDRVLLVPRHDGEYANVGTVAEVAERVRLPGGVGAVNLVGLHRGIAGAAHTDPQGRLRVEVQEQPDEAPPGVKTRELEREYRAVVEEILDCTSPVRVRVKKASDKRCRCRKTAARRSCITRCPT